MRVKAVTDGKQVNIPVRSAMEGRRKIGGPGVGYPGASV